MTTIFARSPLQTLPMAANRSTTRRRSVKQAFEEDDAPAPKRPQTEANGTSKRANGTTRKTAKAAYDEDDDGFQFARRTSRRTARAEPTPEKPAKVARAQDSLPTKAPTRKKRDEIALDAESPHTHKRRRSARLSGDKQELEARPKSTEPPVAKRTKKTAQAEERRKQITPAPEASPEDKSAFVGTKTPIHNELNVAKKRDPNAQRIMLPFADTPVITRNKEMRKGSKDGHRRSSTGLRGRRASSLIDSGQSNGVQREHSIGDRTLTLSVALPHSEVEVRDFYKYIEQTLPEPRRMKQLLTWCGTRALPEKPSGDVKNANAIMAARAIQQELIDDFASKPELSDWFSRVSGLCVRGYRQLTLAQEETAPPLVVKKPNPQNDKNLATLHELEEEVQR